MLRRCISLLVIIGLFASQMAAIPHTHIGVSAAEQQRHDLTPHFHCDWLGHSEHYHDHSHSGRRHTHAERHNDERSKPAEKPDGKRTATGRDIPGHDANAIFVSGDADRLSSTSRTESTTSTWQLGLLAPPSEGISEICLCPSKTRRWHPPDEVIDGSEIYLTLRNLRI